MKTGTQKPIVVFISNRFGYGPTTALLNIVKEFIKNGEVNLVFAGSGICKEAFCLAPEKKVIFCELDERDYNKMKDFLSQYKDEKIFIISCLNRLAIMVAKELNIPNALVDLLTWTWNEIPKGYEIADHYFSNHFGTDIKKPYMIEVPLIIGQTPEKKGIKKKYILVNVGGSQNHLVPGVPENYLRLISYFLNNIKVPRGLEIIVAGGSGAVEFLRNSGIRPDTRIESFSLQEYTLIQNKSKKIISVAGSNSTFMSFVLGIPVIFLLPQLYSHWKLVSFLKEKNYIKDCQNWNDYMWLSNDINSLTEKESILLIEDLAKKALAEQEILNRMMYDLQKMIDADDDVAGQNKFIADVGIGGEKKIFEYLRDHWFKK